MQFQLLVQAVAKSCCCEKKQLARTPWGPFCDDDELLLVYKRIKHGDDVWVAELLQQVHFLYAALALLGRHVCNLNPELQDFKEKQEAGSLSHFCLLCTRAHMYDYFRAYAHLGQVLMHCVYASSTSSTPCRKPSVAARRMLATLQHTLYTQAVSSPFDGHNLTIRLSASFVDNSVATLAYRLLYIIVSKASSNNWDSAVSAAGLQWAGLAL
jgi:hypothetical protein